MAAAADRFQIRQIGIGAAHRASLMGDDPRRISYTEVYHGDEYRLQTGPYMRIPAHMGMRAITPAL